MLSPINGSPGLQTAANSEVVQPGSLKQAFGAMIRRPGLIEKLRPLYQVYSGPQKFSSFGSFWLASYQRQLLLGNDTATIWNDSTFSSVTSPIAANPTDHFAMRTVEANNNLYLASENGMIKLDSITGTPYRSGVARCLDVQLTLQTGTLLANTNSAGYRAVFGIKDVNSNLILGPPSGRAVITATAAQDVSVKVWMPSAISGAANGTSYFVQVQRTPINTTASTDPGEEMQVVYQAQLTSGDLANKFVTFVDATPDALRGAAGYFCPSQEGLAAANYPPPIAHDVALFKRQTFYSDTIQKHQARVQLLGVGKNLLTISTGAGGITKSGGNGVYTFTGSPDLTNIPTDGSAKLSVVNCTSAGNNGEFPITAVNTGAFMITVTNAGAVTEAGTATARAFPSRLTIAGVNYYGVISSTVETPASQLFKVSTGYAISATGTPQQDVRDTSASLLRVVNQQAAPVVYGYYESGPDDGAGKMLFEAVSLGAASFTVFAVGTLWYNSFNPTIPSGTITSANDAKANRLYFAKVDQPEHVPLVNYLDIGSGSKAIFRIIPLREALLVIKEDGVFRVLSDGAGNLSASALDFSVHALSRWGATSIGNRAFCLTVRGLAMITETSTAIVSGPIADKVSHYTEQPDNPPGSGPVYVMWGSELDQNLFINIDYGSDDATYIYNSITGAWTQTYGTPDPVLGSGGYYGWSQPILHNGLVTMLISDFSDVWEEAPTTTSTDSNQIRVAVTSNNVGNSTITINRNLISNTSPGRTQLAVGAVMGLSAAQTGSTIKLMTVTTIDASVPTATVITLTPHFLSPTAVVSDIVSSGFTFIWMSQQMVIEWNPFVGGMEAGTDRMSAASITFDQASSLRTATANMYTETTTSTQTSNMTNSNTPVPTGISTQTAMRMIVPPTMQHARRLSVSLTHNAPGEFVVIRGITYEFDRVDGLRSVG